MRFCCRRQRGDNVDMTELPDPESNMDEAPEDKYPHFEDERKEPHSFPHERSERRDISVPLVSKSIMEKFSILTEINDDLSQYDSEKDKAISLTSFVILGLQSSGKTALVNALTKCYAGYSSSGTATRCVVQYRLKYNRKMSETKYVVDNKKTMNLGKTLDSHFKNIQRQGGDDGTGFSKKTCMVEIEGKDIPNSVFIDTPGFCPQDRKKNEIIESVIKKWLKPENVFMIVIEDGDMETNQTEETLERVFRTNEWEKNLWTNRSIIILTKLDRTIKGYNDKSMFVEKIDVLKKR